jgi:hypothetical protein
MKRPLSAFEQELATAMDEYAHQTTPPAFHASRIVARERRRIRVRISLATVSLATAAGIAACVATSTTGTGGHTGLPVTGGSGTPTTATTQGTASPGATASGGAGAGSGGGGASSAPAGVVPSWPTTPASSPFAGAVPPVPVLASIRVGAHPEGGYDRISLEFTGQIPGYRVSYVRQVVRSGSGATVSLPGSAFLQLTFTSAQAHDANGNSTLSPPATNPVTVGYPELRSYVVNGDFEGVVNVALGLTAPDGFHVSELTKSPTDHVIYVDVARLH